VTPEERAKQEAWLRKHCTEDGPEGVLAFGPGMLAGQFPTPDVTDMTPAQAAAVLAEHEARVRHFLATVGEQPAAAPRTPVQPTTIGHNQVPAS
jgi:hypothetical protein